MEKKSNPREPTSAQRASSWSLLQLWGWEKYYKGYGGTVEKDLVLRLLGRARSSHCCYIDLSGVWSCGSHLPYHINQQVVTTQSPAWNLTNGLSPGGGGGEGAGEGKRHKEMQTHTGVLLLTTRDHPSLILLCPLIPQETGTQLVLTAAYQHASTHGRPAGS